MGLDMYLNGKRYISKYFNEQDGQRADAIAEQFPELAAKKSAWGESPVKGITIEAGYWRKANQIHKWFVDKVQGGNDDCGTYPVAREQLQELRDTCQRVLDFRHLATELLPPQKGFFFGADQIGDWYWEDLELTVRILDDVLSMPEVWDFEYHSSW